MAGGYNPVPCPKCKSTDIEKVKFSWWGGILGPRLFNHVKCKKCGYTYNGKTGKDNTKAIFIYSAFFIAIIIAVIVILNII